MQIYTSLPETRPDTPLLNSIDSPSALRLLERPALLLLADQLRHYLLYAITQSGGHFAANLGVVELTIALHYCLNTPSDKLLWDVGHQAYPHKVLTGRRDELCAIRAQNGLAPFIDPKESQFDVFGTGHSSTTISAALGMALANRLQGNNSKVVCVIGDGALTAGMAYEAIMDAVYQQANMTIILNDNDMSICPNVGGLSQVLKALGRNADAAPNLFSAMGLQYFGPFDGHDLPYLITELSALLPLPGPKLLHVHTTKGRGYAPAETDAVMHHAYSKASSTGQSLPTVMPADSVFIRAKSAMQQGKAQKYSSVCGGFLMDAATTHADMVAITPAMCEGSGMTDFRAAYPKRFFDVAIAEQHALTLAAGMACQGLKPVVAIYSTFLQRGYDQLVHDIALQNLNVTFAIDRAGLVGEDGPTHAGVYDYAFMRTIPNLVLMAPKDENECRAMLYTSLNYPGPSAVRYPRGLGCGAMVVAQPPLLAIGKAESLAVHNPVCERAIVLLAFGSMVGTALDVAHSLTGEQLANDWRIEVINMRFIKPMDEQTIARVNNSANIVVTIEEHALMGGAGSAINELMLAQCAANGHVAPNILNVAIEDAFIAHQTHSQQLHAAGLTAPQITTRIVKLLDTKTGVKRWNQW